MSDRLIERLLTEKMMKDFKILEWDGQIFFVTLRLSNKTKETRSVEATTTNYRHFLNRLNRKVFGSANKNKRKKLRKKVRWVGAVHEIGRKSSIHVHCLLEKPTHIKSTDFVDKVKESWLDTHYGYLGRNDSGFDWQLITKTEEQIFNMTRYIFISRRGSNAYSLNLSI